MRILALNCGSSSLKYQLFCCEQQERLAVGTIDRIGQSGATIKHQAGSSDATKSEIECRNHEQAIEHALKAVFASLPAGAKIDAVGHRVVHGGNKFARSMILNDEVIATIQQLIPLAPLHNPPNLAGIIGAKKLLPGIPHVAVFDTAFHQTMPETAYTYAVPKAWKEEFGVRRYGFHGTSHLFVSRKVAEVLGTPIEKLKIITCHIGNGASITAIKNGKSVDTSMGLTPLEGAVMGTRSGDIDPGFIAYVQSRTQQTFEAIFDALNKKSGMLGMTGRNDLRDIEAEAANGNATCIEALNVYSYRIKKYIGAYAAAMNGVDVIVFTAGVGENSSFVRKLALTGMEYLGVELDEGANEAAIRGKEGLITKPTSRVKAAVVATNEELVIVEDTLALLEGRSPLDPDFKYSFEKKSPEIGGTPLTGKSNSNTSESRGVSAMAREFNIPVAISNRHVHLSRADMDVLFGKDYQLTQMKPLSQPGQYAAQETVRLIGPKGRLENVRVLGPDRKQTQVEVSQTEAIKLGVQAPVRDSGDLKDSGAILVMGPKGEVVLKEGVVVAWRHVHMHSSEAARFGLKDKQIVTVKTQGDRSVVFQNVLARVNDAFALEMHIDTDEANAAFLKNGDQVTMIVGD